MALSFVSTVIEKGETKVELKTRAPVLDACERMCVNEISFLSQEVKLDEHFFMPLLFIFESWFRIAFPDLKKKQKKLTSIKDHNQLILFHSRTRFAFQLNNTLIMIISAIW